MPNQIAFYPQSSGGGSGAVTLISNTTLGSASATVNISAIPATFTNLMLVVNSELSGTSATELIFAQFNGDTAADYTNGYILNSTGTVTGSSSIDQTSIFIGTSGPNGGSIQAVISGYTSGILKGVTSTSSCAAAGGLTQLQGGGIWNQTAAISSILLTAAAGSFVAGSTFSLYGF